MDFTWTYKKTTHKEPRRPEFIENHCELFLRHQIGALTSHTHTVPRRQVTWWASSQHFLNPQLSPLPEPATADEELMVVEFRRWQLVGDHRMDRPYCELQIRHQGVRCIMVATWNLSTVSGANLKLYSLRCRSQEMLSG
ncbi:uncharacterized protein LOC119180045 [Rhipicephalus microplus]|uniref:uncharacterized protein LOC119180045 n=1 Tax=Rhipicephalus microplus TaxID=6941 RepID=UPI003F6C8EC5